MKMKEMNFVNEFTDMPLGRYNEDGPYSGQRFRDEFLVPKLHQLADGEVLLLDLSNAFGFGSSFLEECFGGMVRRKIFSLDELKKKLIIKCEDDPMTIAQIAEYMLDAQNRLK